MENIERCYSNCLSLNPYEQIGHDYFELFGRELSVEQFTFLFHHKKFADPISTLESPKAKAEQREIRKNMHDDYGDTGLSTQFYLPEDKNLEIERLLRYVDIPRHKHEFVEMVCVLNGQCVHMIGENRYVNRVGDFTIIPPSIEHELHASEDCVCFTVKMSSSAFVEIFSDVLLENSVLASHFTKEINVSYYRCVLVLHCGHDSFVRESMLRLFIQQEERRPFSEKIIESLLAVVLAYMLQNYEDTAEFLVSDTVQYKQMIEILNYIFANYQTITLTETARHFHFSVPYLSAKIRKHTGKTFSALIKAYKLQKAAELLLNSNQKIDMVCEQVGYSDTAQFIRSFKEVYGITPSRYRKAHQHH